MEDADLEDTIRELIRAVTYDDFITEDASRGEREIVYRNNYHIDIKVKLNKSQQNTPLKSLEDFIAEIDEHLDDDVETTSTWTEQINNIYDSEPIHYVISLYIKDIEEPS
ncbi:hypothetical protein DBR24_21060 [Pseudomonas sp. HMWF006]|nr:hypothetical protein DBR24_21060 [Pseudomonas sp. HMWF006]PTT71621.1 hypothetical protein DBR26_07190 [Pseudomonas sp. HMWF007]PTT94458.1 hypothetical protein DBR29_03625 [Pseudomonas sp. HMWF005]